MFCIPCCFRHSRRQQKATDLCDSAGADLELESSHKGFKVDLLEDEGPHLQDELWDICLNQKLNASSQVDISPSNSLRTRLTSGSYEESLKYLAAKYEEKGLSNFIPRIEALLHAVQPFTSALNTIVQANPQVAGLVWGSMQILLTATAGVVSMFESIVSMLLELSRSLPRIEAYIQLLPTPQLHQALRNVYDHFVDFCIAASDILETRSFVLICRVSCSSLSRDFKATKEQLELASDHFEREAGLANAQAEKVRHDEMMAEIAKRGSTGTVAVGLPARYPMFRGREDVLKLLRDHLHGPRAEAGSRRRPRRSCVLHAVGGMGKTQIALQFAYQFMDEYSHIFWIRAETETVLTESFVNISDKIKPDSGAVALDKRITTVRDYLFHTPDNWLIVFDNVQSGASIKNVWPAGDFGNIIVTTQLCNLDDIVTLAIPVLPMPAEEGGALIRAYLQRGGSEAESAERISKELGGLPLAIAHFSGFVKRSQCSLEHVLESLRERKQSRQIWEQSDLTNTNGYSHTLETVWHLAFRRLSPDARDLIYIMAFLEADHIPEEMFIGKESTHVTNDWPFWSAHRFNLAASNLRERNLIERMSSPDGGYLKTHRSLQQYLLHYLDRHSADRDAVFEQAVKVVRQVFPRYNLVLRGDTSNWPTNQRFIPHILSLGLAFDQSDPPMPNSMIFAELLHDGAYFLWSWHIRNEAVQLLDTARTISEEQYKYLPRDAGPLLAFIESQLGIHDQYGGVEVRQRAVDRTGRALVLYQEHTDSLNYKGVSKLDHIAIGRFFADHACCWLMLDDVGQMDSLCVEAINSYKKAGPEDEMKSRYGVVYVFRSLALAIRGEHEDALHECYRGVGLMTDVLGASSFYTLWVKFLLAMVYWRGNDQKTALNIHREVLEGRQVLHPYDHHDVLSSQYMLAVAYQRTGDLESAETHLRRVIEHRRFSHAWRQEDLARAQFRLSILLRTQGKPREAAHHEQQAWASMRKWETNLPSQGWEGPSSRTMGDLEQNMRLFDLAVSTWHGRTTGKWSRGGDLW